MKAQIKMILVTSFAVGMMLAGIAAMTHELRRPWPQQGSDEWSRMAMASPENTVMVRAEAPSR